MGGQSDGKKQKKNICAGLLAHVDAGKTTLSEALLYIGGSIRRLGRVDNRDAFLDTYELERARGITIFSKQAILEKGDVRLTLLDTPGHVDFSAEMERTLQVLDYAVLVISGSDGVQGHTETLWRLLQHYQIPTFLFINKMDLTGTDRERLLQELRQKLDDGCLDMAQFGTREFYESAAMTDEEALEFFLEQDELDDDILRRLIAGRKIFPCYFGSALKLSGVEELLDGIMAFSCMGCEAGNAEFGARVFKISRDEQGTRLTHMKITSGSLRVKEMPGEEKINQIRIYSGEKYEVVSEVHAGDVCAVTGPVNTRPGEGMGIEKEHVFPVLEPVLTYRLELPEGCEAAVLLPKLRQLEEEEPELHVVWDGELKEIQVQLMGEIQMEVLKSRIAERFGVEVGFGAGNIVYKETIEDTVEGVGHFEPLRHYAEVHLLLEPGERGSGVQFTTSCSEDVLDRNWQRLILTNLMEKEHRGVLIGAPVTDICITLVTGRAHQKHTEGGDFRQATYRAVRQGLMQASSVLLEPYYSYRLELPEESIGRAMADMERMSGTFEVAENKGGKSMLTGTVPVATARDYQKEVAAYTRGRGHFTCTFYGYLPCHDAEAVIESAGYDPERDTENPADSVFCSHGAGYVVSWDQVKEHMHVEAVYRDEVEEQKLEDFLAAAPKEEIWIGTEEVDRILARTYYANRRGDGDNRSGAKRKWTRTKTVISADSRDAYSGGYGSGKPETKPRYLLVDGYNIIFAWEELSALAEVSIDGARGRLMDILCNYQALLGDRLMLVFDAYRVAGHQTEVLSYHNILVVYTKEAETADQYIEKFAHENGRKYDVTVATSDGLEQIIIQGNGCKLVSARELREEILLAEQRLREDFLEQKRFGEKTCLLDGWQEENQKDIM